MAQLFLYLTLFLATTVGMGEGYSLNAESLVDDNTVCFDQTEIDVDSDTDSSDACSVSGRQFFAELLAPGHITSHRNFLASAYRPHHPIRAPPYVLS